MAKAYQRADNAQKPEFTVVKHESGHTDHRDAIQGRWEMLEIKDQPPKGYCPYVIYVFWKEGQHKGTTYMGFKSLDELKDAWKNICPYFTPEFMDEALQRAALQPGFLGTAYLPTHEPWFYGGT